jgi:hypothetical protein
VADKRSVVGSREHGNETSASVKYWEFLYNLSNYQLLKESAPQSAILEPFNRILIVNNFRKTFKEEA